MPDLSLVRQHEVGHSSLQEKKYYLCPAGFIFAA